MAKLDGKEPVQHNVPMDAHEKILHGPHTYSKEEGYKAVEAPKKPKPAEVPTRAKPEYDE